MFLVFSFIVVWSDLFVPESHSTIPCDNKISDKIKLEIFLFSYEIIFFNKGT